MVPNEVYAVDVELWPTNVVVECGGRLVLEVSSGDTAGSGFWGHDDPIDRYEFDKIHPLDGHIQEIN